MASIFENLAQGGYFELQDIVFPCQSPDGTLEGTSLQKWQGLMLEGLRNLGKDFEKVKNYGNYMRDAGFVDIVEKKYTWAIGPWIRGRKQKLMATWWMQNFLDGIHGWSMAIITRGMGWQVFLESLVSLSWRICELRSMPCFGSRVLSNNRPRTRGILLALVLFNF